MVLDNKAPLLLTAPEISPTAAKLGDEVVLSLSFVEALEGAPVLDSDLPFELIAGSQYSFSFTVTEDMANGFQDCDVTVTDSVGNSYSFSVFDF